MHKSLSVYIGYLAIAFCFLSFGIWELLDSHLWIGYVPAFASNILDATLLVQIHGVALIFVALGVLSGFYPKVFLGLSILLMLEICFTLIFEEGFTDTFIRDGAILLFIIGLFVEQWRKVGV